MELRNWLLLAWLLSFYAFGLLFFCRGFLLNRHALLFNSSCADVQHPGPFHQKPGRAASAGCWVPARFDRAVLVVIDALRYDFAEPRSASGALPFNPHFHGRLAHIGELLHSEPRNSLLFRFRADAPTTTLQRLKGLTTGSLPTFIDAGSNFAGAAIDEDNIISQLVSRNNTVVMMGDDTWEALFPGRFRRSYPLPSFDVKDLHSVDNGVLAHIYEELAKEDWSLLIGHFLGVDHCGHKFGPDHPEMGKKLDQMDGVLRCVGFAAESLPKKASLTTR